jgi:hypothetical protein
VIRRKEKSETYGSSIASQEAMIGPDLLNMCEFPTCLLGRQREDGLRNTIFFRDRIFDEGAGRPVERELIITGSDFFGLPTSADSDVLLVLMYLSQRDGMQNRDLYFSRREMLGLLQWDAGGKSYTRLLDSLHRWVSTSLHFQRSWWDQQDLAWQSRAFNVLESIEVQGKKTCSNSQETSRVTWNSVIHASLGSSNVKRLNLKTYFALRSPAARQAYRFLDKRFYRAKHLEFDLRTFACEHIGFSRSYDNGVLKSKLKRAIDELEEHGFLQPIPYHQRFQKLRCGQWRVRLTRALSTHHETSPDTDPKQTSEVVVLGKLQKQGVSGIVARRLVDQYPISTIDQKIRDVDQMASSGRTPPRDRAAFLVAAIRGGYELGGTMRRRARRATSEPKKMANPETARKVLVEADQLHSSDRVSVWWEEFCRLPKEEAERIEQAALESASPLLVETYHRLKQSRRNLFESVRMSLIASYMEKAENQPLSPSDPTD